MSKILNIKNQMFQICCTIYMQQNLVTMKMESSGYELKICS